MGSYQLLSLESRSSTVLGTSCADFKVKWKVSLSRLRLKPGIMWAKAADKYQLPSWSKEDKLLKLLFILTACWESRRWLSDRLTHTDMWSQAGSCAPKQEALPLRHLSTFQNLRPCLLSLSPRQLTALRLLYRLIWWGRRSLPPLWPLKSYNHTTVRKLT